MDSVLLISPFERAQLIDTLWQSLDPAHQSEIDQAWLEESNDRLNAYQRGEIEVVDGESVLSELKEKLSR